MGLGLVAGTMGGLLGIGGGVLIVPGLVFCVGFSQHRAHGTSLVSALLLAAAGSIRYNLDGNVNWPLAAGIAVGGVGGAMLGARAANAVRAATLRRVFAVFLLLVSVRMVLTALHTGDGAASHHFLTPHTAAYWLAALGTGLVTGFISGLMGVGGGVVMIPAMVLLMGLSQVQAQGVSLAAMIPTALSGIRIHRRAGNVDVGVGKWTGLGAAAGAIIGATAASHLAKGPALPFLFAAFLVVTASLMLTRK